MSIKLGIAPIAWSNDDMPELGGDTTLEQCLSQLVGKGLITTDEAVYKCNRPNVLKGLLEEINSSTNINDEI